MTTWSGTPRTWTAGEVVTAGLLNANLRDPLVALSGAWNSYTPTWGLGITSIGNGTLDGRYIQVGKLVMFRVHLVGGSTTSWGSSGGSDPFEFGLPVAAAAPYLDTRFSGTTYNTIGFRDVVAVLSDADTVRLYCEPTTAGNALRAVNTTTPDTFAAGHRIAFGGAYEAA